MQAGDREQERRPLRVQAAQDVAHRGLLDARDRRPRRRDRGGIAHRQRNARRDLRQEEENERAAEHVRPPRAARHALAEPVPEKARPAGSMFQPAVQVCLRTLVPVAN